MSVAKINAITVERGRFEEFAERFANRAGHVERAEGFESFQLLRPNDERNVCLVITQWRSEEDFRRWLASPDFQAGHRQHGERGPVGSASELWSFDLLEDVRRLRDG
jgi:heme-degrading monooxygenase HmoA